MAKKQVLIDGKRYDLDHFKNVNGTGALPEPVVEKRISAAGVPAPVDENGDPITEETDAPEQAPTLAGGEEVGGAPAQEQAPAPAPVTESLPPAPAPKAKGKGGRPKKAPGAAKL